jgi:hypothetical protein
LHAISGCLFAAATAFALGRLFTRKLDVPVSVRYAAGAAVLHLIVFGLLLAGWAWPPVFAIVGAVSCACGLRVRRLKIPAVSRLELLVAAVVSVFAVVYAVNALAPETQADANVYHLSPAIEASQSGGFAREISFYQRLPHATELLFVFAYAFGGASAAKLLHLMFLCWTFPLIVSIGRRIGIPDPLPLIGAAMYFVTPVAGVSGSSAFNDAALVFYVLATVWVLTASNSHALLAGVFAGMCYAVKMNGGIAIAAGGLFLIATKRWREVAPFAAGVAAVTLPWLLRNLIDTGNPFAPFFNAIFANPYFYVGTEERLTETLRSYGVPFRRRFWEVAAGSRLHGAIGPMFLLAPLTLIALHRRPVRWLWLWAAVFSAGWWLNAGARFLLPALPFLALAVAATLPSRIAAALLLVHAVLSWPWIIPAYSPRMWRIERFPWRTAVGCESPAHYLARDSLEYQVARVVGDNTGPTARIFDFVGLHKAHIDRNIFGPWQSAEGERLIAALELARSARESPLLEWRAHFEPRVTTAVRLRHESAGAANWSLNEILLYNGDRLPNNPAWRLDASENRWDAPFAFDRFRISRWSTWRRSTAQDFFLVEFGGPQMLDSVAAIIPNSEHDTRFAIDLRNPDNAWLAVPATRYYAGELRLRLEAMRLLSRAGVTHIVTEPATEGIGALGRSLIDEADDWGFEVVANYHRVYLLRIVGPLKDDSASQ